MAELAILFGLTLGAGYVGKKVLRESSSGGGRSFGEVLSKSISNAMMGRKKKDMKETSVVSNNSGRSFGEVLSKSISNTMMGSRKRRGK